MRSICATVAAFAGIALLGACAAGTATQTGSGSETGAPLSLPPLGEFCLEAQRVVVRSDGPGFTLVNHPDLEGFVKSKAIIEPLTIQQYVWPGDDASGGALMISCKLKSADHLNEAFGPGTAAPGGSCQDMNRRTYDAVVAQLARRTDRPLTVVVLEPDLAVGDDDNPGMGGPAWLQPFVPVTRDQDGRLHLQGKSLKVDWLDPRFARAPAQFRGVHYCHFIAPAYLQDLLTGHAEPGLAIGVDVSSRPAPAAHGLTESQ